MNSMSAGEDPEFVSCLEARYEYWASKLTITKTMSEGIIRKFTDELTLGLKLHKERPSRDFDTEECSLYMVDTCVHHLPTTREQGVYYAVDLGGTHLRAGRVHLEGKGKATVNDHHNNVREDFYSAEMPQGLVDPKATATMLFDQIATKVEDLMKVHGDTSAKVGFTFSFGVRHVRINQAVLLHWTKSFRTGLLTKDPVVGRDIVALLTEAFKRRNMPCKVVACLNDSTGTLITGAYESSWRDPKCIVGMIIGTGYNMCYVEPEAESFNYIGSIINIESGSFGRGLPRTAIDYEVDLESSEEGLQQLEKMVSGLYVGELCRHLLLRVFQASVAPLAWKRNSLSAEVCLTIFNDDTPDLTLTATALKEIWHWDLALEGRKVLKKCVTLMVRRSAALVATIVAAVCYRTRYLQPAMGGMTIAVDGSLYTQNPLYRDAVRSSLALILGSELCDLIKFQVTSDGSGRGAAILACIEDNADS